MIAVTTPTGQIGSKVVNELLNAKEAVRVIVRDPAKPMDWIARSEERRTTRRRRVFGNGAKKC